MQDVYIFLSHCLKWMVRSLAFALPIIVMGIALGDAGIWISFGSLCLFGFISYAAHQGVSWGVELHNATLYTYFAMPIIALVTTSVLPFIVGCTVYFIVSYCTEWLPYEIAEYSPTPLEVAT